MAMNNFRHDSHVAQQSRRDKLRVQQHSSPHHHVEDFSSNLDQLSVQSGLNPDLVQFRNARGGRPVLYDPVVLSSQMINFSSNVSHKDAMTHQEFPNSLHPSSSNFNHPSIPVGIPRNSGNCDWVVNYSNGPAGNESNSSAMFIGETFSTEKVNNVVNAASALYVKPNQSGYQDVHSCLTNPSSEISSDQDSQKHYGEIHFSSPQIYQSNINHGSWGVGGNQLILPSYGNQWSGELGFTGNKSDGYLRNVTCDSNSRGLSLSLSSNPQPQAHTTHIGEGHIKPENLKSSYVSSNSKPSLGGEGIVATSNYAHRNTGPLGPFTGYATILKSSKFLKPAQTLLDEFCSITSPKDLKTRDRSENILGETSGSGDAENTENDAGSKGGNSAVSSSTLYHHSNEFSSEGGNWENPSESHHPEFRQKKAKLLYMQDEVCRRYKQYHQQMQMVVSAFETVAGLSAATPYISLALKAVSRHFRCLRNDISGQLKRIGKALGEDLSSLTTGTSSSKGDTTIMPRLRFVEQNLQKHKSGGGNLGFLEPQQVWRPQRGLPERSVAVLRAWLFEHFLHPYPTDTDKHMLATQTGLSRNQVSNWFINARVRVWKPMVEEIHMLETKGLAENDGKSGADATARPNIDEPSSNRLSEKQTERCEWSQEKRSRVGCEVAGPIMDGSLMGFVPYHRSGLDSGGLGAVSLTLGLRHSAESAQQQQQEQQLRQHFGGHMIHDFVG